MNGGLEDLNIRLYEAADEAAVIALWRDCGLIVPWNDPKRDIDAKTAFQPEFFYVGEQAGRVVASVMAGYEGHRGWINYLAVRPDHRRRGLGRRLMEYAEERLRETGCQKINLQVRETNTEVIAFYEALGYSDDKVISLGKKLD